MNTPSNSQPKYWLGGVLLAVIAVLGGMLVYQKSTVQRDPTQVKLANADLIVPAHPLKPFHLQTTTGHEFSPDSLQHHWTFLFFGFTHCPQLCPTTLTTVNKAFVQLTQQHALHNARLMFVTVDPERDNLLQIKQYLAAFNKNFIGATGSAQAITSITKQFGILYAKVANDEGNNPAHYTIDHSGVLLLINPKAQLQAIFSLPHHAQQIADDFTAITQFYG